MPAHIERADVASKEVGVIRADLKVRCKISILTIACLDNR